MDRSNLGEVSYIMKYLYTAESRDLVEKIDTRETLNTSFNMYSGTKQEGVQDILIFQHIKINKGN